MIVYPKVLTYDAWLDKYILHLPKNKIIKVLYLPFYILGFLIVLVTEGIALMLVYIIAFPFYLIYRLIYSIQKTMFFERQIIQMHDDLSSVKIKIKNIESPTRDGFEFVEWINENGSSINNFTKILSGTKIIAKWRDIQTTSAIKNKNNIKKVIQIKLSGVTFENRQQNIIKVKKNDILDYVREPNNIHDKNAILIKSQNGLDLGYIPKEHNCSIAAKMDRGIKYNITVSDITGLDQKYKGINIQVVEVGGFDQKLIKHNNILHDSEFIDFDTISDSIENYRDNSNDFYESSYETINEFDDSESNDF